MKKPDQPIIIFDGVCTLCEYSVQFIVKHDRQARFKFVSAQSDRGKMLQQMYGVDVLQEGTVILLKDDHVYVKSDAAVEIAKDLDGLWRNLHIFGYVPKPVRDFIYSKISRNRYRWFGKRNECLLPENNVKQRFL